MSIERLNEEGERSRYRAEDFRRRMDAVVARAPEEPEALIADLQRLLTVREDLRAELDQVQRMIDTALGLIQRGAD